MTQPANRRIVTEAAVDGHLASKINDTASAARAALNATCAPASGSANYASKTPTAATTANTSALAATASPKWTGA